MAHVGASSLLDRIKVDVDDLVQVQRRHLRHFIQALEVVGAVVTDKSVQRDGGQVAHRDLVRRGVLDDLGAKVGTMDRAQVLLVGLAIGMVLVEHVRRAGLHLRLQDSEPQLLRLHRLQALALRLELRVHALKLLAKNIHEALTGLGAVGRVWAEECPIRIVLDTLHEEVRDPKRVEEITCPLLLFAVVLLQLEEVEDVRVPGLQVHGEGSFSLAAALVNIAGGLVEVAEHGDQAVTVPVGAADVAALGADVGNRKADATRLFGDQRTLLQGVVDALDAVGLHGQQEARRHLWLGSAGVEQGRRRMRELPAGHEVVGLDGRGQISRVDAARNSHHHVLGPLHDLVVNPQQVGPFQGLEAEVVVIEIPGIVHGGVKCSAIVADKLPDFLRNERRISALLVGVLEQRTASL
mmetsp:Transcript_76496/g.215220  ORF Transcript_76496/g.215220 Transcript_76496/m.215220 type:complete len:409 (-) Transcript_76496:344-1570(-)